MLNFNSQAFDSGPKVTYNDYTCLKLELYLGNTFLMKNSFVLNCIHTMSLYLYLIPFTMKSLFSLNLNKKKISFLDRFEHDVKPQKPYTFFKLLL